MLSMVIVLLFFAGAVQGMDASHPVQREAVTGGGAVAGAGAGSVTPLHCVDGVLRLEERLTELPDFESRCARYGAVTTLDCSDNTLAKLPAGALLQLPNLETIILRNNPGLKIANNAFTGLLKLREIDLGDCELEGLPDDCFDGCSRLERLLLAGNRLRELPASLHECEHLRELDLSRNGLEVLPNLRSLRFLEKLTLDQNRLGGLVVDRLPLGVGARLVYFSCRENLIAEFPETLLDACAERNMVIDLQGNPFFAADGAPEILEAYRRRHGGIIEPFDPRMDYVIRGDYEFAGFVHEALHGDTADKYLDLLRYSFPDASIEDLRVLWERQHPVDGLRTSVGDGCALMYRHRKLILFVGVCVVGGFALSALYQKLAAASAALPVGLVSRCATEAAVAGVQHAVGVSRAVGCATVGVGSVALGLKEKLERWGDGLVEGVSQWNLRREIVDVSSRTKRLYKGCGLVVSQIACFKQYVMAWLVYGRLLAAVADKHAFEELQCELVEFLHLSPRHQIRLRCRNGSELLMVLDQLLASNAADVVRSYAPGGVYVERNMMMEGLGGDSVQIPTELGDLLNVTRRASLALGRAAGRLRLSLRSRCLGTWDAGVFIARCFAEENLAGLLRSVINDYLVPVIDRLERVRGASGADVRIVTEWIGEIHHLAEYVTALHTYALGLQRLE